MEIETMKKDNILFGIIGILLGFIVGFMFANNANRGTLPGATATAAATTQSNSKLPPDHPPITTVAPDQNPEAMADVQASVKLAKDQPDNFDAQMKAAEAFYQIQRFDDAVEYLKRANQLKPDAAEPLITLGDVNFDASKFEEAEKWYTQALKLQPTNVNVRTDLGLTFFFRTPQNIDRAIKEFKASLEIDPNHIQTLQNLTVAYTKKGDASSAQATLDKLTAIAPTNQAIAKLRSDLEALKSGKPAVTQPASAVTK